MVMDNGSFIMPISDTVVCHNDNLWYHHWRQSWHPDKSGFFNGQVDQDYIKMEIAVDGLEYISRDVIYVWTVNYRRRIDTWNEQSKKLIWHRLFDKTGIMWPNLSINAFLKAYIFWHPIHGFINNTKFIIWICRAWCSSKLYLWLISWIYHNFWLTLYLTTCTSSASLSVTIGPDPHP